MSKKRQRRARARQIKRTRESPSGAAKRARQKKAGPSPETRRLLSTIFWVAISLILALLVGMAFYYAVVKPNLARLAGEGLGTEMSDERTHSEEQAMTPLQQWSQAPAMTLKQGVDYRAILRTEKGEIHIDLFQDQTPVTVNNFVFLARQGYYDNVTFHRVIANFMAQTGDPTGTGRGGPGYTFPDEFVRTLRHNSAGIVSMANRGPNTNGSQFFITYGPTPHLDGAHTVFGRVTEGMDVLRSLRQRDPADPKAPAGDRILTIEIVEQ